MPFIYKQLIGAGVALVLAIVCLTYSGRGFAEYFRRLGR